MLSSPDNPDLKERAVDIWFIELDRPSIGIDDCDKLLSGDERDRVARFKFPRDQRRYVVSHAALRSILGGYLKVPPKDLKFSSGPNGKPKLTPIPGKHTVRFNLSHSHELAVVAVTRRAEIGVDVEYVKEDFAFEEVAQRFFSAKEVAALTALPSHLQRVAFFKCWTSKEAFLKAKGTGLSGELDEVEIVLTPNQSVRVNGTIQDWTLSEITVDPHYMAAVVVAGHQPQVVCYRWDPATVGLAKSVQLRRT